MPKILVLNSYHEGFPWTDDIVTAFEARVLATYPNATIDIEYMDTKSEGFSKEYQSILQRLYTFKFADRKFDLIVTTDDNAFEFLRTNHANLFKNTPTIFAGVNNFELEPEIDTSLITGVFEKEAERETIEAIKTLLPNTQNILLIYDNTETGNLRYKAIEAILHEFPELKFERVGETGTLEDLIAKLSSNSPNTAAILASYYQDSTGAFYELADSTKTLSNASQIPIFTLHSQVLKHGTVGGKVLGGQQHGTKAAELALLMLNGISPSELPMTGDDVTEYQFDAIQLARYNIDQNLLPTGSIVLNQTPSFREKYGEIIYWWSGSILTLALLVSHLLFTNEQRRRAQRLFENLFNTIDTGILRVDARTRDIVCNRRAEEFLQLDGVAPDKTLEVIRTNRVYRQDGSPYENAERPILKALETGEEISGALVGIPDKKSTKRRWFDVSAFPQRAPKSREIEYVFCTLHEVTEQRQIEEQLRQAEKMEALGKVVAGVAHDFNNGLAIVRTSLDTLALSYEDSQYILGDINDCKKAVDRCVSLTERLLGFARRKGSLDTNGIDRVLDLNAFLQEANLFLRRSLTPEIEIDIELCELPLMVKVNRDDLENALINLVVNAKDAMQGKGYIKITTDYIEASSSSEATAYAKLVIADEGLGIAKDDLQHIFEPFYSTKALDQGTGLGLSMVYGFVKRSGGKINVVSEIGKGSEFQIELPITKIPANFVDENLKETRPQTGSETILVVDDEELLLTSTCKLLETIGYSTFAAANFDAAKTMIDTKPEIELMISDIVFTGTDSGIELSNYARAKRPDLAILLTSGNLPYHREEIQEDTKTGVLQKPYRAIELSEKIRELLGDAVHSDFATFNHHSRKF